MESFLSEAVTEPAVSSEEDVTGAATSDRSQSRGNRTKKRRLKGGQTDRQRRQDKTTVVATAPVTTVLTAEEETALFDAEGVIKTGLRSFVDVGQAITQIRDRRLYRAEYASIEEYLERRWKIGKAYGYRLIKGAAVVQNLSPIGDTVPENEAQVRALLGLTAEQQRDVWPKVLKESGTGLTARLIKAVVDREFPPLDPNAERLEAARKLPDLLEFCRDELITARAQLEPMTVKLLIINAELTDTATVLNTLKRHLQEDCGVITICSFQSEPEVRKALTEGKCKLVDRTIWYGQIGNTKTTGSIARHRSILLAERGEFRFSRDGVARLPDPLVHAPDSGFPDAPPEALLRALIDAFTVEGESVVVPADRYAAGVIAARRSKRKVLGLEREEKFYLMGRERLDGLFDAAARLDREIEASRADSTKIVTPMLEGTSTIEDTSEADNSAASAVEVNDGI